MTTLVSINLTHAGASLHRYETARAGGPVCTHAGIYDLETVTATNLQAYRLIGAPQDRVGVAARRPRRTEARTR
jgi:hypothetical protein